MAQFFQMRPPFSKPMIFLAGARAIRWTNRHGRMYLRAPGLPRRVREGIRRAWNPTRHGRRRSFLVSQGDGAGTLASAIGRADRRALPPCPRAHGKLAGWRDTPDIKHVPGACQRGNCPPISLSVYSQDIIDDLSKFKERALTTHVLGVLPKMLLKTPGLKRKARSIDTLLDRVLSVHTLPSGQAARGILPTTSQPARERSAVPAGIEPAICAFGATDCRCLPWRCPQFRRMQHGVAARDL